MNLKKLKCPNYNNGDIKRRASCRKHEAPGGRSKDLPNRAHTLSTLYNLPNLNTMLRYSFPKLFVLACTSLLLVLAGCDQSAMKKESTGAEEAPKPTKQEKELNAALDAVAKDVAAALENRSVRTLIKKETGKLLAGQRNVLFQTIASKKVEGLAKDGEPLTFEEVLAGRRASLGKDEETLSKSKAVEQVRKDAAAIPKFDIGVPMNHKKWDPKTTTPLVAFHHRQEIDDTELKRLKAYDAKGNVHWLDAQKRPEPPVVVVGINERTTADGTVRAPYRERTETTKNRQRIEEPGGGGSGGGGGGGGGSTEDPRDYGDNEYLQRVKITQDGEPPYKGDPEVRIHAKAEDGSTLKTYISEKRDGSNMTPWNNSDDKSWITHNVLFYKWVQNVGKNYTMWAAWEYDDGKSASLKVTYRDKTYGFNFKYTDDVEDYGTQRVQFPVDDDQVFDLGGFKFELESREP